MSVRLSSLLSLKIQLWRSSDRIYSTVGACVITQVLIEIILSPLTGLPMSSLMPLCNITHSKQLLVCGGTGKSYTCKCAFPSSFLKPRKKSHLPQQLCMMESGRSISRGSSEVATDLIGLAGRGSRYALLNSNCRPCSMTSVGLRALGFFLSGWRSRVEVDPQFPFKVLMEELVGVSACVIGDMASRPNFGLGELDFVFSTLVVGSIMNFTLMYLLAPKASDSSPHLPALFTGSPSSHMFESGPYTPVARLGTFVYKGSIFAAVGLVAGLAGTLISNGLIKLRKKMDPGFETSNKPPPIILNAITWAIHMGISSNLRYQTLNGLEFYMARWLPPFAFKISVIFLRCLNNIVGGMSFVTLARITGSQSISRKTV